MSEKELHHPCMNSCSGWKQGFERGQAELGKLREQLEQVKGELALERKRHAQTLWHRLRYFRREANEAARWLLIATGKKNVREARAAERNDHIRSIFTTKHRTYAGLTILEFAEKFGASEAMAELMRQYGWNALAAAPEASGEGGENG